MELVPEGFYRAVVSPVAGEDGSAPVQFGVTKEDKPQVLVNFEILDGSYQGRVLPWWGSFNSTLPEGSKAKQTPMQRTLQSLRFCGWVGDDVMEVVNQELGNEVSIQVEHAEGQDGVTRAKVAWVNRPGGGGVMMANPMSKDSLRRFSAAIKSVARSIPPVPGKKAERGSSAASASAPVSNGWSGNDAPDPPRATEYNQAPPVGSDDDIPF
jgi:hypothetical protein